MISWVVMLVSRLLDYVANIDDEPPGGKKHLVGKERERALTGTSTQRRCFRFLRNTFGSFIRKTAPPILHRGKRFRAFPSVLF